MIELQQDQKDEKCPNDRTLLQSIWIAEGLLSIFISTTVNHPMIHASSLIPRRALGNRTTSLESVRRQQSSRTRFHSLVSGRSNLRRCHDCQRVATTHPSFIRHHGCGWFTVFSSRQICPMFYVRSPMCLLCVMSPNASKGFAYLLECSHPSTSADVSAPMCVSFTFLTLGVDNRERKIQREECF